MLPLLDDTNVLDNNCLQNVVQGIPGRKVDLACGDQTKLRQSALPAQLNVTRGVTIYCCYAGLGLVS